MKSISYNMFWYKTYFFYFQMDTLQIDCDQSGTNSNNDNRSKDIESSDNQCEAEPMFMCEICKKEFIKKNSLRRHIVTAHLRKSKPTPNDGWAQKTFICKAEGCTFETNHAHNLKRHSLIVHRDGKVKPSKTMNKCSQCNKKFSDIRNLRFHMRKIHNTGDLVLEIKRQCPLCPFTSTEHEKTKIHAHFENDHGIPMVWETRQFNTMGDFINWKHNTEKLTTTSYVRSYCTPNLLSFQCHRSGSYKKKGFDKRRMKEGGSCKINAFCPSGIVVKVFENNVVCASYLATHIGHTNEPEHIRMTPEERTTVSVPRVRRKKTAKRTQPSSSIKRAKTKKVAPESTTTVKRTNTEIEMEKLMLEVQQDMEECDQEQDPPEHALFLEHVADVHPSSVECLNLPHGTVENCHITVLTALQPTVISCIDLQEEKNKFLESFIRCINESVQTLDDLEYVRQHCQAILPTLRDSSPLIVQPGCEGQVSVITQLSN